MESCVSFRKKKYLNKRKTQLRSTWYLNYVRYICTWIPNAYWIFLGPRFITIRCVYYTLLYILFLLGGRSRRLRFSIRMLTHIIVYQDTKNYVVVLPFIISMFYVRRDKLRRNTRHNCMRQALRSPRQI